MKLAVLVAFALLSQFSFAEKGTLILAHGSMKGCGYTNPTQWEQGVHEIVNRVRPQVKHEIQVAFGMWNTMCFQKGVQKLQDRMTAKGQTLTELEVLPLFLSSHSVVIEMQKYIFKKRRSKPINVPMAKHIKFSGVIKYQSALDYNPHLAMIMANRLHTLIHDAKAVGYTKKQMEVVFLMHGPVGDADNTKWMAMAEQYKKDLNYLFPLHSFHIVSLRDDAPTQTRDEQTRILREITSNATANGRVALVLPYLLSKGGIQQGILDRLQGLDYIWSGEAVLPDAFFDQVVLDRL
jgi:hypothetical protein